jgi:hypothetical protein
MNMKALTGDVSAPTIKLVQYYERNGFVPVNGTDLMILDMCLAKAFSIGRSPSGS